MFERKKKPKILKDIDKFALDKLAEKTTMPNVDNELSAKDFLPKCKNCGGQLERVNPPVELPVAGGALELHECLECHEREYI